MVVVILIHGIANPMMCQSLWRDLQGMTKKFCGLPIFFEGDFNVTLTAKDRHKEWEGETHDQRH